MAIFLGILYALQLLVALLLILIILMQRTASEGLGLAFGGGMGESFFGSRAGNVLVKITAYCAVFFICNTLVIAKLQTVQGKSMVSKDVSVVTPGEAGQTPAVEPGTVETGTPPETGLPVEVTPLDSTAPSVAAEGITDGVTAPVVPVLEPTAGDVSTPSETPASAPADTPTEDPQESTEGI